MLHATLKAARPLGVPVVALHVHHGLSPQADDWLEHGQQRCRRWARAGHDLAFASVRLTSRPSPGESVEAWARQARYRALADMALAHGCSLVLLAHHRRDQAETFLLQALRGGGAAALSAMPRQAVRDGLTWARPWLDWPREAIDAYARRHRLRFVEDDSNIDARFARNRLRGSVWPLFSAAFPEAEASLASAAGQAQIAATAMEEWAAVDLPRVSDGEALSIAAWRRLSSARQGIALHAWLRRQLGRGVSAALIERLLREADEHGTRRWQAPQGELRSYRGLLQWHFSAPMFDGADLAANNAAQPVDLSRAGRHAFAAWQGAIVVRRVTSGGMPLHVAARLELRDRRGGERFKAGPDRPTRSLKQQYQAAGIPAGERTGPLAFHGELLVFASGLGIDARAVAAAGEPQLALTWRRGSATIDEDPTRR